MENQIVEIIKQTTKELMEKMGFSSRVEIEEVTAGDQIEDGDLVDAGQNNIICNIDVAEDSNLLIGQFGGNLQALQHIIRLLVRKKTEEKVRFIVDVNRYRQEKNQSVIEQAELAAQQAITENRAVVMKPMSSYERRIVHLELLKNSKVTTESIGEGEGRKVVVRLANTL